MDQVTEYQQMSGSINFLVTGTRPLYSMNCTYAVPVVRWKERTLLHTIIR
jgi:hypothetical protein